KKYKEVSDLKALTQEELFEDEKGILTEFFKTLIDKNYTLLIGWNTDEFDVPVLFKRLERHLGNNSFLDTVERQRCRFLDAYVCFRKTRSGLWSSWKLDDVANKIYGAGKLFKLSEKGLLTLTPDEMQAYTIIDADLVRHIDLLEPHFSGDPIPPEKVKEILEKQETRLTDYYVELAAFSNIFPDETTQSTKVADGLLLRKAREHNYVLPNKPQIDPKVKIIPIKGARVMDPQPGVHELVANLDFSSLYPNIIIFWKISPDKEGLIYPELLKELIAKRKENKNLYEKTKLVVYNTRQQALKILANALYGAFIYPKFRLFDRAKGEQVTLHGRELISMVKDFVEEILKYLV
ncbi:MAG: DNA polymerase domain-containing protein, partial [Ignavibacteria bacterium]